MSEPEAQNKIEAAGDLGLEDVALYKVDARLAHSRPFTYGSDDGRKVDHRHVEAAARRLDRVLAMPPGDTATVTDPRGQITGLTDGVEYMVRIAAVNSLGLTPAAYADHWTHQHQPTHP